MVSHSLLDFSPVVFALFLFLFSLELRQWKYPEPARASMMGEWGCFFSVTEGGVSVCVPPVWPFLFPSWIWQWLYFALLYGFARSKTLFNVSRQNLWFGERCIDGISTRGESSRSSYDSYIKTIALFNVLKLNANGWRIIAIARMFSVFGECTNNNNNNINKNIVEEEKNRQFVIFN